MYDHVYIYIYMHVFLCVLCVYIYIHLPTNIHRRSVRLMFNPHGVGPNQLLPHVEFAERNAIINISLVSLTALRRHATIGCCPSGGGSHLQSRTWTLTSSPCSACLKAQVPNSDRQAGVDGWRKPCQPGVLRQRERFNKNHSYTYNTIYMSIHVYNMISYNTI